MGCRNPAFRAQRIDAVHFPDKDAGVLGWRDASRFTPIHDVVSAYGLPGLVAIAHDADEFALAMDAAIKPQSAAWQAAVAEKLASGSWDQTWNAMWKQVERIGVSSAEVKSETIASFRLAPVSVKIRSGRNDKYDYLVVGAGLAGAVLAERLANGMGKRVLIIDKRSHVAGNTFDCYDDAGILVHKYGPHIFHTNSSEVVQYLSQFTEWRDYEHRVLASV